MRVVRRGLVVPSHFPCVHVDRDERAGEEIVAFASLARVPRRRITRADDVQLRLRIVGARNPRLAAAVTGRLEARPCVESRIAGFHRHGVELPLQLAGLRIERLQEAGHVEIVAGPDQDVIADDHRRRRGEILLVEARDFDVPALLARPGVERHEVIVGRLEIEVVVPHAGTAVADVRPAARLPVVPPQLVSVDAIERPDVVRCRHVEHTADLEDRPLDAGRAPGRELVAAFAADDNRRARSAASETAEAAAPATRRVRRTRRELSDPGQAEALDGRLIDLGQRAVPPAAVITGVGGPRVGQRLDDCRCISAAAACARPVDP